MLALERKVGQRILLETSDGPVIIELVRVRENRATLGLSVHKSVKILREELRPDARQP